MSCSTDIDYSTDKQPKHPLAMVPGPIEMSDQVLEAAGFPGQSHVGPAFVEVFGKALGLLRTVFQSTDKDAQPFILSGAGTLGWDVVASNLIQPGEKALVVTTGYFGDAFADCISTYGGVPVQVKPSKVGTQPCLEDIEKALKGDKYKVITITHVDTSTGVLAHVKEIAQVAKKVSPSTLIIVDGVCSVVAEEICFDNWGLDVVLTASQKALGSPPGLSILMLSKRALDSIKNRSVPVNSYFANINRWLPIMQNYEAGKASYFSTPAVQTVHALLASLEQITSRPMSENYQIHKRASDKVKGAIKTWGLEQVALDDGYQAHGMTAVYYPPGVTTPQFLPLVAKHNVVLAGGLHKDIASKYFRIGHMGVSADLATGQIDELIDALKSAFKQIGYLK